MGGRFSPSYYASKNVRGAVTQLFPKDARGAGSFREKCGNYSHNYSLDGRIIR
jgi:hypothetical protein